MAAPVQKKSTAPLQEAPTTKADLPDLPSAPTRPIIGGEENEEHDHMGLCASPARARRLSAQTERP